MNVTRDDLRAAVATGTISEAQAASLLVLAEEREGYRLTRRVDDEPFELFKGFNEIFIVVGLLILYTGYGALTAFATSPNADVFNAAIALAGIAGLAEYFTRKRRMIAPSIALSIMFAVSAYGLSFALATTILTDAGSDTPVRMADLYWFGDEFTRRSLFGLGGVVLAMLAFWGRYRVPFAMALIGGSVFVFVLGLVTDGEIFRDGLGGLFNLAQSPEISLFTLGLGLIGFAVAMGFDMSDPHRVSRRAGCGFWLHVISAPAIVNVVALTLYQSASTTAFVLLALFLICIAAVAIIIDRRSFLVSGIGYMIALLFATVDGSYGAIVLGIGLMLVLLGANWETMRRALMNSLPDFPGKTRLPPYEKVYT